MFLFYTLSSWELNFYHKIFQHPLTIFFPLSKLQCSIQIIMYLFNYQLVNKWGG